MDRLIRNRIIYLGSTLYLNTRFFKKISKILRVPPILTKLLQGSRNWWNRYFNELGRVRSVLVEGGTWSLSHDKIKRCCTFFVTLYNKINFRILQGFLRTRWGKKEGLTFLFSVDNFTPTPFWFESITPSQREMEPVLPVKFKAMTINYICEDIVEHQNLDYEHKLTKKGSFIHYIFSLYNYN